MRKCQKRPIILQKRPIPRTKETYRYSDMPERRVLEFAIVLVEAFAFALHEARMCSLS